VIRGVVRLACDAASDLELAGEAGLASTAAAVVTDADPDVTVLDIDLPDGDGIGVIRELREGGYAGSILVLTDRHDGASVLEAMRLGATGYLGKAEGLRRITRAIRRVAAGERLVDERLERAAVMELGRFADKAREGSEVRATLTAREQQILELMADGLTMQQIGRRLAISPRTVETHVAKLYRKLGVRTRVQAVARAAALGLIDLR
jgi:DNA-binding NarL/FixJ family response regulator